VADVPSVIAVNNDVSNLNLSDSLELAEAIIAKHLV